jgi:hypothetical protein
MERATAMLAALMLAGFAPAIAAEKESNPYADLIPPEVCVARPSDVIQIDDKGKLVKLIRVDESGKPILCAPYRITWNNSPRVVSCVRRPGNPTTYDILDDPGLDPDPRISCSVIVEDWLDKVDPVAVKAEADAKRRRECNDKPTWLGVLFCRWDQ